MAQVETSWLTGEAYDRLRRELDELIASQPRIAAEINARRQEGDLEENVGFFAACEEQARQEARIHQLRELLRTARVGLAPADTDTAQLGMLLTVRYGNDGATETFLLGSREEDRHGAVEAYSPRSPLGAAILGARVGQTRHYRLPDGGVMSVTLQAAEPFRAWSHIECAS